MCGACGACGAGSAGAAARHWSAPFLASVPARDTAARNLTRWSRRGRWSGTVRGVAGGFEVASATGRRSVVSDLGAAVALLQPYGVGEQPFDAPSSGVVEGSPTRPGRRLWAGRPGTTPWSDTDVIRWVLPPDPRRCYRVPALLTWLALAERADALGRLALDLDLGGAEGVMLSSVDGAVSCEAAAAPECDVVRSPDETLAAQLRALLGVAAGASQPAQPNNWSTVPE